MGPTVTGKERIGRERGGGGEMGEWDCPLTIFGLKLHWFPAFV